jgi:peptide/nickel transport system substrate-binding protein
MLHRRQFAATVAALPLLPRLARAAPETTLRVVLREDADALDPTLARTYVGRIVFCGLFDKLFDIDEKLQIVPQLAAAHEWTDPTTLVLHLRPGVVFQDGERMDAAAVKYSLDRHLTLPGSFRRSEIGAMDRAEVVDPLTVKVVLKQPSAPFLAQLADRAGMIVSPKAADAAGKDFGLHPVGAGPFRFVERVAQDRIVLERFPGYWDAGNIHLDRVVYLPMPDAAVRLANLQAGSVELVEQIVPTDVGAVKKNPKLRFAPSDSLGYQGITINVANGERAKSPIGQDARVRQAFELSLDRDALVQVVYDGLYSPTRQAVSPASPFYVADDKPPARDVARAQALLKAAGVTGPVTVNMTVPNNPDLRQVGEVIQSMAGEAGFDVKIALSEFAALIAAGTRGDFEAELLAWSGRVDPDGNIYSFLHTGGGLNDGHYSNADVDAALDKARLVDDVGQRRALYGGMWRQLGQDLPLIYLWALKNTPAMSARVQGFRAVPDGMIRLQGLSLSA